MKNIVLIAASLVFLLLSCDLEAKAGLGKLTVTSGSGDELVIKHGLFHRKTLVEDRFGDGFATTHSIFGSKSKEINLLGNGVRYRRGILGLSDTEAHTLLGDRVSSHKGLIYRNTQVDLSGVNQLLHHCLNPQTSQDAPAPKTLPEPQDTALPRLKPNDLN